MEKDAIQKSLKILQNHFSQERKTTLNRMRGQDPYKVLVGCIVSINIKDDVTEKILEELFTKADSFKKLIELDQEELEKMLYLARYRRIKANTLKNMSKDILERYQGVVPDTKEELLTIKGIGPKTANVVLNFAFNKPYIPVDSNTLRIANRLGWIKTEKHEEVEKLLNESLDEELLRNGNAIFMLHGKNICLPVSPYCSRCPVNNNCEKNGVERSR